jgi:hypothetical protein
MRGPESVTRKRRKSDEKTLAEQVWDLKTGLWSQGDSARLAEVRREWQALWDEHAAADHGRSLPLGDLFWLVCLHWQIAMAEERYDEALAALGPYLEHPSFGAHDFCIDILSNQATALFFAGREAEAISVVRSLLPAPTGKSVNWRLACIPVLQHLREMRDDHPAPEALIALTEDLLEGLRRYLPAVLQEHGRSTYGELRDLLELTGATFSRFEHELEAIRAQIDAGELDQAEERWRSLFERFREDPGWDEHIHDVAPLLSLGWSISAQVDDHQRGLELADLFLAHPRLRQVHPANLA